MNDWFAIHPGGKHAFCGSDGPPISVDEAARWFNPVVADSRWTVLRGWHVFRHSFVSCLAMKSVDQRVIDASVGHQTDEIPGPHYSRMIAVVGHTPLPEILDVAHLICLDTGCGLGGWLTAFDVNSRQCWQVDERWELRIR